MKIQDALFFFLFFALCFIRKDRLFLYTGLICLMLAIPLFYTWVFFTAERLTWYGAGFILTFLAVQVYLGKKNRLINNKEMQ